MCIHVHGDMIAKLLWLLSEVESLAHEVQSILAQSLFTAKRVLYLKISAWLSDPFPNGKSKNHQKIKFRHSIEDDLLDGFSKR